MSEDTPGGGRVPPVEHRFKKGQSGNPRGRPKGSGTTRSWHFLLESVTLKSRGRKRTMTRGEHLMHYASQVAIGQRDSEIGDTLLQLKHSIDRGKDTICGKTVNILLDSWHIDVRPTCADDALRSLGVATVLYRFKRTARMRLAPWAVTLALARLETPLSREDQAKVLKATQRPARVVWPEWWEPDLKGSKRQRRPQPG